MTIPDLLTDHPRWTTRGYLPHCDGCGILQFVTCCLADAVPPPLREGLPDHTYGRCALGNPAIASMAQDSLLHFHGVRYDLSAWVIMPNHVHFLIRPLAGWSLAKVLHGWKGFTGHEANRLLGTAGPFWQREHYDTYIRDDTHFGMVLEYIHGNPVKAGLCSEPEAWEWSSARLWRAG